MPAVAKGLGTSLGNFKRTWATSALPARWAIPACLSARTVKRQSPLSLAPTCAGCGIEKRLSG
eukprot:5735877-Pyramimonas_sp.AAC.1